MNGLTKRQLKWNTTKYYIVLKTLKQHALYYGQDK